MSNTAAKVNNYIALGYLFLASETRIAEPTASASQEFAKSESRSSVDDIRNENTIPVNNQVVASINFSSNYNGLRV